MKYKDLTNFKSNQLTVIELDNDKFEEQLKRYKAGLIKNIPNRYWKCRCECCGNYISLPAGTLKRKLKYSCGCEVSPNIIKSIRERSKKYNVYDLTKEIGIGYAHNNNKEFYFDKEDFNKIKDFCWMDRGDRIMSTIPNEFPLYEKVVRNNNTKVKHIALHHLILEIYDSKNIIVDHINRNPRDNRKSNLRIATPSENMYNRSKGKNNTSGIIGVRYNKKDKRWRSEIGYKNQNLHLGQFINKEEAIKCRLQAELKYFGRDFAPQRDLFEKYGIKEEN